MFPRPNSSSALKIISFFSSLQHYPSVNNQQYSPWKTASTSRKNPHRLPTPLIQSLHCSQSDLSKKYISPCHCVHCSKQINHFPLLLEQRSPLHSLTLGVACNNTHSLTLKVSCTCFVYSDFMQWPLPISAFSQSYGFPSSHIRMWELDHKEGWEPEELML